LTLLEKLCHIWHQHFGSVEDQVGLGKEFQRHSQETHKTVAHSMQQSQRAAQRWEPNLLGFSLVGAFKTGSSCIGPHQAVENPSTLDKAYSRAFTYEAVHGTKK
jgi:hypothetical protein